MSVWGESNIAFIDVETTGLDPHENYLLEIAVLVTDKDLNILDEVGYQSVVKYDYAAVPFVKGRANTFVTDMHEKTGLWDKLAGPGAKHAEQIDRELAAYLAQFGEPKTMPVGGNSVRLDMNFIDAFLPETSGFLDYHMRDVSTVAGLAEGWYGQENFAKVNDHTAMTDVRESIRELKHYRETVFRTADEQAVWRTGAEFHRRAIAAEADAAELRAQLSGRHVDPSKVSETEPFDAAEDDLMFRQWLELGRKSGWISDAVCISHDMIPMTPEESEEDDPCVHVLRLYPDAETKRKAEEE